jgi:NCS2 family nucleobase:cation symporter-2
MPKMLKPMLDSGILLASLVAVLLNAYFNVRGTEADARGAAAAAAQGADHI